MKHSVGGIIDSTTRPLDEFARYVPGSLLSLALQHVSDGVVIVDEAGKVRSINPAAIALLDLDAYHEDDQEPRGQHAPRDTSGRMRIELPQLHYALRGHRVQGAEHRVTRRDGETTWLSVTSEPFFDGHGIIRGAVATIEDISKSKQIEHIKDDFLAATAHELRTPVTALFGYINLMVKRAEQSDWGDRDLHALRMIKAQAERLTQLINGLIDVSRAQTGSIDLRCQQLDLHALTQQAAKAWAASVVEHTILVDGPEQAIPVWGDAQRLDQVLSHLIGNAVKFSPWGGTVRVQVWMDEEAHVSVADSGIGIPEEARTQLFQRFFRANNVDSDRISGLGIGLYLVKELVAAHSGRIEVRSAPDEGTTFEVILPLSNEEPRLESLDYASL